jgi:hypothetical protein
MFRKFNEDCPRTGERIRSYFCDVCIFAERFEGDGVVCLFGEETEDSIIERHAREDRAHIAAHIERIRG